MGQMHDKIGFSYSWVQSSGFNPFESKEVENLLKKGMRLVWELVDWWTAAWRDWLQLFKSLLEWI